MAAAASKSLPQLEHCGDSLGFAATASTAASSASGRAPQPSPGWRQAQAGQDAPGLTDRGLAAGKAHIAEVTSAFEAALVPQEELPAPDAAIGPVTRPVQNYTEEGSLAASPIRPILSRSMRTDSRWA